MYQNMGMIYSCLIMFLSSAKIAFFESMPFYARELFVVCANIFQIDRKMSEAREKKRQLGLKTHNETTTPIRNFGSIIFRHNSHLNMVEIYHTSAAGIDLHSETAGHQHLAGMVSKGGTNVQHQKWCKTSVFDTLIVIVRVYYMWYILEGEKLLLLCHSGLSGHLMWWLQHYPHQSKRRYRHSPKLSSHMMV